MVPRLMAAAAYPGRSVEDLAIHLRRLGKGRRVFFQLHRALEHLLHVGAVARARLRRC